MDDTTRTIAAAAFEIGVPVALIAVMRRARSARGRLVVILGATTPFLILYAAIFFAYLLNPESRDNRFAFFAGWEMSFATYLGSAIVGVALSFAPRPRNLFIRYGMGCACIPIGFILTGVLLRVVSTA